MEKEEAITNIKKFKNGKEYIPAFKLKVLEDLVLNNESDSFIARKHGIPTGTLYSFRKQALEKLGYYRILEEMKAKRPSKTESEKEAELTQLKEALALSNLKIAALETLIDVAEENFNVSIRKKSVSKQSK